MFVSFMSAVYCPQSEAFPLTVCPVAIEVSICVAFNKKNVQIDWWKITLALSSDSLVFGDETLSILKGATIDRLISPKDIHFIQNECLHMKWKDWWRSK